MSDDIDDILSELTQEQTKATTTEVTSLNSNLPAPKQEDSLPVDVGDTESVAEELVKMTLDDRNMADKIFQLLYPEIGAGRDRSQASKEALTKALELRIGASKNLIELMKIIKGGTDKNGTNIGIFMGEKKAGINISRLQSEVDD